MTLDEKLGKGYSVSKAMDALWSTDGEPNSTLVCQDCQHYFTPDNETSKQYPLCECCRDAEEKEVEAGQYDDPEDVRNRKINEDDPRREQDFESRRIENQTVQHFNYLMNCRGL